MTKTAGAARRFSFVFDKVIINYSLIAIILVILYTEME